MTSSGHDFQRKVAGLLGELLEGSAETKRLGRLDQQGIDVFVYRPDDYSIQTAIQCKGFEVMDYGKDQHRQCRAEIAKFAAGGPHTPEYWLVVNRPIKDRTLRDELDADLQGLVQTGRAERVRLFDLDPFLVKVKELAAARLATWSEAKRAELFAYYADRLRFVEYIPEVPFSGNEAGADPVTHILKGVQSFFRKLPEHQTGRYRPSPKILLTSGFGFGKTSALHALARAWSQTGGHLIYAPAALLGTDAFTNSSNLASELLGFLIPDDVAASDLVRQVLRDTLRYALSTSTNWILLIDGLDENPAALRSGSLVQLRGCISDLGIPAVVAARDELVDVRPAEFAVPAQQKADLPFERIGLLDWPDLLILRFVDQFAASRGGSPPDGFSELRELVRNGRYGEVYGDIPKRPLFLGMLAQDAWSGNEPARQLHRLYGRYFLDKFLYDRHSVAAGGASTRPSRLVDAFGLEEAQERLILIMQDAAAEMTSIALDRVDPGTRTLVPSDTIAEDRLRSVATARGVEFIQFEDLVMHSLLQPAGRNPRTRQRMVRFAHRSFQDWFLARHMASSPPDPGLNLPEAVARFLAAMRADLAAGALLP